MSTQILISNTGGGASGLQGIQAFYNGYITSLNAVDSSITGANLSSYTVTSNVLICNPFTPNKTINANSLRINVTTQGGAGTFSRILIYSDLNGLPDSKLFESTDISIGTTGIKTILTSFTFTAGTTYWLAYYCNSGHVTTGISNNALPNLVFSAGSATQPNTNITATTTFGSAPSTFVFGNYGSGAVPRIVIAI